jgi:hypothetical protein
MGTILEFSLSGSASCFTQIYYGARWFRKDKMAVHDTWCWLMHMHRITAYVVVTRHTVSCTTCMRDVHIMVLALTRR